MIVIRSERSIFKQIVSGVLYAVQILVVGVLLVMAVITVWAVVSVINFAELFLFLLALAGAYLVIVGVVLLLVWSRSP